VPCSQTVPACDGFCPNPADICIQDAVGCHCGPPLPKPCLQTYPACDGYCPNATEICVENPLGTPPGCHCEEPQPCDVTYPSCDGFCPIAGQICRQDATTQKCNCEEPPPPPCLQTYPACDGLCPNPGEICMQDPTGIQECTCQEPPPPPCVQSFPACDGPCPNPNDLCVDNPPGTPPGCHCEPPPPPLCENSPFPQCGGLCPVNQFCKAPAWWAKCKCCPNIVPPPVDDVVFHSKTLIAWTPWLSPCTKWHVYVKTDITLRDSDHDGVADDYGTCFDTVTVPEATAPGDPGPGRTHYIIVTAAEEGVGEGSMGAASNGLPRPNVFPCP
jgi:hypothetical protein